MKNLSRPRPSTRYFARPLGDLFNLYHIFILEKFRKQNFDVLQKIGSVKKIVLFNEFFAQTF